MHIKMNSTKNSEYLYIYFPQNLIFAIFAAIHFVIMILS
jgi:hypothetical protein